MYTYGTDEYTSNYSNLLAARQKTETEPYIFLTPEWCAAYEKTIKADERYKQVARTWEGSVVLVFLAEPDSGVDRDVWLFLDLWHGECKLLQPVPEGEGKKGDFVLQANYGRWEKIVKGELNVVKELATRQLKLTPFDLKKAVKLAAASQAAIRLVELAGMVGARYPGDLPEKDQEIFRYIMNQLNADFGI